MEAMDQAITEAPVAVTSVVSYLKPMRDKPYNYLFEPPDGGPWDNCEWEPRRVRIHDARRFFAPPALDRCGFQLVEAPTRVRDFRDNDEVIGRYYGEAQALALRATGGARAHVFDHLVRKREEGRPALTFGRKTQSAAAAVGRVHNDYTERSGRRRLRLVLGGDAALAAGRYCIVNIWRSISGPVVDTPLALCDSRSVAAADLVESEIRYPARTGEIYLVRHNPGHRWSYFHELQPDEAIVFKQYDSVSREVPRFTPHAAFDHPDTPPDAPLRESIEVRVLVLY